MQNLSDNELDGLFKDASRQEPGFDSGSWEQMEKLLDRPERTSAIWNTKVISGLIGVALLTGTVLILTLNKPGQSADSQERDVVEANESINQNEAPLEDKSLAGTTDNAEKVIAQKSIAPDKLEPKDTDKNAFIDNRSSQTSNPDLPLNDKSKNSSVMETIIGDPIIYQSDASENVQITGPETELPLKEDEVEITEQVTDEKEQTDHKKSWMSNVGVKLALSPDFSSENFSRFEGSGFNYGLLIEYRISKRIFLSSGAILSKKVYSVYNVEYDGHNVPRVDGDCRIIDIPLNLYYHFPSSKSISFYTSLGFSSYLMKKENYVNVYPTWTYAREVENENNEWFKMLNVSIGIQKQLSNRFSIQVEPFLKAPLAGVGEGDVSLASIGAFLNAKYMIFRQQ